MSSTRLPGKSLANLAGMPLIQRVVDRARAVRGAGQVVVLTSVESSDDVLAEYCKDCDIPVRRGPLADVYARFAGLVSEFQPRYLVRVTGDCPLIDPQHIDRQLDALETEQADFAPAVDAEHLYPGQGALSVHAFEEAGASQDPRDREHVGSFYFARCRDRFREVPLEADPDLLRLACGLRLCVDEPQDLELMRRVFDEFAIRHGSLVPLEQVIRWLVMEGLQGLNGQVVPSEDNRDVQRLREARS